ncbi:hypothetical protein CERZMDRAFT_98208 [Cercospora zeae-maydis SCOH1-5]|uniref:Uncharacterized protein n=1 Tax=Cercospora zeae-maydis SCOH1-5 TaxID=717836 RepID=A0A6A6FEF2_9PEZI|nr:hypothetical protein CERZMDRAFT_98208 [Cercospora zeae-maydis SCOH1-5]
MASYIRKVKYSAVSGSQVQIAGDCAAARYRTQPLSPAFTMQLPRLAQTQQTATTRGERQRQRDCATVTFSISFPMLLICPNPSSKDSAKESAGFLQVKWTLGVEVAGVRQLQVATQAAETVVKSSSHVTTSAQKKCAPPPLHQILTFTLSPRKSCRLPFHYRGSDTL